MARPKTIAEALKFYYPERLDKGEIKIVGPEDNRIRLTQQLPCFKQALTTCRLWGRILRKILKKTIYVECKYYDEFTGKVVQHTERLQTLKDHLVKRRASSIIPLLCLMLASFQLAAQTESVEFDYFIQTVGADQKFRDSGIVQFDSSQYVVQLPTEKIEVNVYQVGKSDEGDLILYGFCGDRLRVIRYPSGDVSGFFLWSEYQIYYLNVPKA